MGKTVSASRNLHLKNARWVIQLYNRKKVIVILCCIMLIKKSHLGTRKIIDFLREFIGFKRRSCIQNLIDLLQNFGYFYIEYVNCKDSN